jgi:cytochrome c553
MKQLIFILASILSTQSFSMPNGKKLVSQNCIACHGENSQAAPTFQEVHSQYLKIDSNTSSLYEQFLKNTSKNSKVKKYVKKYGFMPQLTLTPQEIKAISEFLSKGNFQDLSFTKMTAETPIDKGKSIAASTKSELGKNLLGAIKKSGTKGAINFCNAKALPITNKKIKEFNAKIKRATDKPRNSLNLADKEEMHYIELFKKQLKNKSIKPQLVETKTEYHYYSPIITNKMCLQCHGSVGKNIKPEVYKKVKKLYPKDKAINYGPNQVRGIFSIRWKK